MRWLLSLQNILDQLSTSLLGEEAKTSWMIEIYGSIDTSLQTHAFGQIGSQAVIAYLDLFGNLSSVSKRPELMLLRPQSLEQTLSMSEALLTIQAVDTVMIDSLFWLSASFKEFENALIKLADLAAKHQKQVILLNPENGARNWLQQSLQALCSQQIKVYSER